MRIQHNIMAMNSYRNYTNNTKAVSKNLEKLSSGYRINRAGDDAAGLAISEKMRAQITGLKTAEKNAKDGISLVQTAEGALTEVHSMLNRMAELADQSANGTYDDAVDRANLQKEVSALKTEVNRIADSSNFNGIKLLDGSLSKADLKLSGIALGAGGTAATAATTVAATSAKSTITAGVGTATANTLTVNYKDASGNLKEVKIEYTGATVANDNATAIRDALKKNKELSDVFDVGGTGANIELTAKVAGEKGAQVLKASSNDAATTTAITGAVAFADGVNEHQSIAAGAANLEAGNHFTLNGKTYELVANASSAATIDGATAVVLGSDDTATIANLNKALEGSGVKLEAGAGNALLAKTTASGRGLTLQIGDTAEDFNKLTVKVGDMHAKALGIEDVDISSQSGATDAIAKIKGAINSVSSTRGDLGATQNRLDHTINNLSVMRENIQDAESSIRDVDVAEEMMSYTKNNILVQSAQAMLAQANQAPQGVLQLLQ